MAGKTIAAMSLATAQLQEIEVSLPGQLGAVDGIAKVVQAAVFLLDCEAGSIRWLPKMGANPYRKLQGVPLSDMSQIQTILSETAAVILRQLRLFFPPETSDELEQVNSLSITARDYDVGSRTIFAEMLIDTAFSDQVAYPVTFSHVI